MPRIKTNSYPLFWCISQDARVKLCVWQWENYKLKLDIPPLPEHPRPKIPVDIDDDIQIEKFMAQPPSRRLSGD